MKVPVNDYLKNHSGFTLIETIISIVVVAVGLVGVMLAFTSVTSKSADPMFEVKTVELAQAYLDEILAKRFDENSPVGGNPPCTLATCSGALGPDGETRSTYDDVDDYNGLSDSPPQDAFGVTKPGYDTYQVDVTVTYVSASEVTDFNLIDTSDGKRIQVDVGTTNRQAISFTVFKGNF